VHLLSERTYLHGNFAYDVLTVTSTCVRYTHTYVTDFIFSMSRDRYASVNETLTLFWLMYYSDWCVGVTEAFIISLLL